MFRITTRRHSLGCLSFLAEECSLLMAIMLGVVKSVPVLWCTHENVSEVKKKTDQETWGLFLPLLLLSFMALDKSFPFSESMLTYMQRVYRFACILCTYMRISTR